MCERRLYIGSRWVINGIYFLMVVPLTSDDRLRAGCWVGVGLIALYRRFEGLRPDIAPFLVDLVAQAKDYWRVDHKKVAPVEFRVPLEKGLRDVPAQWSNRMDITVAQFLLECFNLTGEDGGPEIVFDDALWSCLETVVGNLLEEQHPEHGHWNEPVEGKPLAAATMMAIQVLQNYLKTIPRLIAG